MIGSATLYKKPRRTGGHYPHWYLYLRFPGQPDTTRNTGYPICGKCAALGPHQLPERTACPCRAKAKLTGQAYLTRANDVRNGIAPESDLHTTRLRRHLSTIGDIIDAYLATGIRLLKSEVQARRNANDLLTVLAHACSQWTTSPGTRGIPAGTRIPDTATLRNQPASILSADTARAYLQTRSGGTLDWNEPQPHNITINSCLRHARDIFSTRALALKFQHLKLPDLAPFLKHPLLPEPDPAPDPIPADRFRAMLHARAHAPADLALANLLLTRTGLRSSYILEMRWSWIIHRHDGAHFIQICDRPGEFRKKPGTRDQLIPISPATLTALGPPNQPADYILLPDQPPTTRARLIERTHNAWLKDLIGGRGQRTQGNHRLRDTVASILWTLAGATAAQEALGHTTPKTTARHYAASLLEITPEMRSELQAWTTHHQPAPTP